MKGQGNLGRRHRLFGFGGRQGKLLRGNKVPTIMQLQGLGGGFARSRVGGLNRSWAKPQGPRWLIRATHDPCGCPTSPSLASFRQGNAAEDVDDITKPAADTTPIARQRYYERPQAPW